MINPYVDGAMGTGPHAISQDLDGFGNMLVRPMEAPIVKNVRASFVYSLCDTGMLAPTNSNSRNLSTGAPAPAALNYNEEVAHTSKIWYAVRMEVDLRLPRTASRIRATLPLGAPLTGEAVRPGYLEYDFFSSGTSGYVGAASLAALLANMSIGYAAETLPYMGDPSLARVPSGFRSPYWPFDHLGCYRFYWPSLQELAFITTYPYTAQPSIDTRPALQYLEGWVPGYSLTRCVATFDPSTLEFDTTFTISISTALLYPMVDGTVAMTSKDIQGLMGG